MANIKVSGVFKVMDALDTPRGTCASGVLIAVVKGKRLRMLINACRHTDKAYLDNAVASVKARGVINSANWLDVDPGDWLSDRTLRLIDGDITLGTVGARAVASFDDAYETGTATAAELPKLTRIAHGWSLT